jgi:hypothetical protein
VSDGVFFWWLFLCVASVVNVLAWSASAVMLGRHQHRLGADVYRWRRIQLWLSAGYVFGCAFRSLLPVYDVPRICLFDTGLSSALVGRTVATVAELCFAAQWALLLREVSGATGSRTGIRASAVMVPMIAIAETFSWYSVLTTSNFGHVVEETIWGSIAVLLVISFLKVRPHCDAALRPMLTVSCIGGVVYVAFMFLVDVPMYWSRWLADEAAGRSYLSLAEGLLDASRCGRESQDWAIWKSEIPWMSLYFSIAVWFSIALVHLPGRVMRPADVRR